MFYKVIDAILWGDQSAPSWAKDWADIKVWDNFQNNLKGIEDAVNDIKNNTLSIDSNVEELNEDDYETYRSGKYIPGIMGTLFSLVDKLVSSLSATVVGIAVSFVGLQSLPTQYDPYTPGMNWVVIVLFCVIPMVAWAATLIAMKGYALTGEKMKEIQAVNACRRDAVANGMKLEDAREKWQTVDQLPAEYRA